MEIRRKNFSRPLRRTVSRRWLLAMPPLVAVAAVAVPTRAHAKTRVIECLLDLRTEE